MMDHSAVDQAVELLARVQRGVLLAVPSDPPADAFASMVALALALDQATKPATMVSPSHVPPRFQFLPGTSQVVQTLPLSPTLRLDLPLHGVRPRDVRWEITGDTLRISVDPDAGRTFPETTVRVQQGDYPWDLIITIGVPRLHALGPIFTSHAQFFYETPILNIDRGTANEFYGATNLVPATVGTLGEVVTELLESLGGVNVLRPEVATCLLAAIMAGTDSFRAPTTTPRTFQVASRLVEQDADRAAIVRNLFRTHALPELRLFGRVLTRMDEIASAAPGTPPLLSVLTAEDFRTTETTPDATPRVLGEALEWVGEHRTVILSFERHPGTLEALIGFGRVSSDDRDAFAGATKGVRVGPWVLVNLGNVPVEEARAHISAHVVPRLPQNTAT